MSVWKFVVIADYRTGSNLLVDTLKAQRKTSGIFCFHEIFNPNIRKDLNLAPLDYLDTYKETIKTYKPVAKFLGFKIMYDQIADLKNKDNFDLYDWIQKNNITVVVNKRKNIFLQHLSFITAQKAKKWRLPSTENPPELTRVSLDIDEFLAYKQECLNSYKKNITVLKNRKIPYLEITYENLMDSYQEQADGLVKHILGQPCKANDFKTLINYSVQQNPFSVEDRVINWDTVSQKLQDSDFYLL